MSGAKHTPGPWEARAAGVLGWFVVADSTIVVDTTDEESRCGAIESDADASLIAAAPLLLDALEMCARFFGADEWEWGDGTPFDTAKIHAAIRAARRGRG